MVKLRRAGREFGRPSIVRAGWVGVAEAFASGLVSGSSLPGGLLALGRPVGQHTFGTLTAARADVSISAAAYYFVEGASAVIGVSGTVALGLFAGAFVFTSGTSAPAALERR